MKNRSPRCGSARARALLVLSRQPDTLKVWAEQRKIHKGFRLVFGSNAAVETETDRQTTAV